MEKANIVESIHITGVKLSPFVGIYLMFYSID